MPAATAAPDVLTGPSGYHPLHPDVSVNFQLNRWLSAMTPRALADLAEVAARAPSYPQLIGGFLALGDRLLAAGRRLDAAFCYRAAEFFLTPDDQRKAPARRRFVELVRGVYGIGPHHLTQVPYQDVTLPVVWFGQPHRGTVVLFGGFDSYLEERVPAMLAFARAGYQVIAFEGPGQGAVLDDHGLPMAPDWHLPLGAVLDHFRLERVTVVGVSLGGGLATRAGRPLDALARRRMRHDLLAAWGIAHGQRVLGAPTPHAYLQQCKRYVTADVSPQVTADVLLLAGAADHYVPASQLRDQIATLTCPVPASLARQEAGVLPGATIQPGVNVVFPVRQGHGRGTSGTRGAGEEQSNRHPAGVKIDRDWNGREAGIVWRSPIDAARPHRSRIWIRVCELLVLRVHGVDQVCSPPHGLPDPAAHRPWMHPHQPGDQLDRPAHPDQPNRVRPHSSAYGHPPRPDAAPPRQGRSDRPLPACNTARAAAGAPNQG